MVFCSLGVGLQTMGSYCVSSSTTAEFTNAKRHINWLCLLINFDIFRLQSAGMHVDGFVNPPNSKH